MVRNEAKNLRDVVDRNNLNEYIEAILDNKINQLKKSSIDNVKFIQGYIASLDDLKKIIVTTN